MNIKEQEQQLFDEWSNNRDDFVSDGVVSEQDYLQSKIKICFVLKEVNDLNGGGWDLREYLKECDRAQTWDNVVRWLLCINSGSEDIGWGKLKQINQELRVNALRSICAFNMKKYPGSHTSDKAIFQASVKEDEHLINRQYNLYHPDITICCGTGWEFRDVINDESEVFETKRGINWFLNDQNKPVIMFVHPEARVPDQILIYSLNDAVREILQACKLIYI